jgi:hypothetical protein
MVIGASSTSDEAAAQTRGRGATKVQGRRTTRSRGGSAKSKSPRGGGGAHRSVVRRTATTTAHNNSNHKTVRRWVRVDRPPGNEDTVRFTVKTWVPVDQLTPQERVQYNIPISPDEEATPMNVVVPPPPPLATSEYSGITATTSATAPSVHHHPQQGQPSAAGVVGASPLAISPFQPEAATVSLPASAPIIRRTNSVTFLMDVAAVPQTEAIVTAAASEVDTEEPPAKRPRLDNETVVTASFSNELQSSVSTVQPLFPAVDDASAAAASATALPGVDLSGPTTMTTDSPLDNVVGAVVAAVSNEAQSSVTTAGPSSETLPKNDVSATDQAAVASTLPGCDLSQPRTMDSLEAAAVDNMEDVVPPAKQWEDDTLAAP